MMELQDQSGDAKEFVENVKEDILAEEIYVFTPDGTVRSLPKDSGPIDFAYEIHTKGWGKSDWCQGQRPDGAPQYQTSDGRSGGDYHQCQFLWSKS